ncbi:MAG TPA: hypothetical protein VKA55_07285, partial [Gammaproteobacteria bacterium]|nr:hypothetical protein [Gammaproteobacteria bacterium]
MVIPRQSFWTLLPHLLLLALGMALLPLAGGILPGPWGQAAAGLPLGLAVAGLVITAWLHSGGTFFALLVLGGLYPLLFATGLPAPFSGPAPAPVAGLAALLAPLNLWIFAVPRERRLLRETGISAWMGLLFQAGALALLLRLPEGAVPDWALPGLDRLLAGPGQLPVAAAAVAALAILWLGRRLLRRTVPREAGFATA